jgi:hypothetical protein
MLVVVATHCVASRTWRVQRSIFALLLSSSTPTTSPHKRLNGSNNFKI